MSLLRVTDLGRRYGGLHALQGLTLDVPVGARHGIIGPNGAGKSTLLHLVAGTVRPSTGRIEFDGKDLSRLGPAARARRGIGRTWQHPAVFRRLTVAANVMLAVTRHALGGPARRPAVAARVHDVLERTGLTEHAAVPAGQLPYGVQRLLEFAVMLAARPRLLLLDEPSAGLDPEETTRLRAAVSALPAGVTTLLIDHNLDLVWSVCDTVTVLAQGRHLATGTPEEVRADEAVRAAYLTVPQAPAAPRTVRVGKPLLRVSGLRAGYHGADVLAELDLEIAEGDLVAVLGRNGAGKTTLLNAIAGLVPARPPTRIELDGTVLPPGRPHRVARAGVAIVPQGRRLFALSVAEHLEVAAATARRDGPGRRWTRAEVLELLPALAGRLGHHASRLSGGEQQMLALSRALLTNPRLLILDEPSEGLAPAVVAHLATTLGVIAEEGVTVLMAEQNLDLALRVTTRALILADGRVALSAPVADLDRDRLHTLVGA
jgi:branched-chain amino acid transport system ATP-binding protein